MSKYLLKKKYVGTIVNRDMEVFKDIKHFAKINQNIKFINLFKKDGTFSPTYFKKRLKKYPKISYIVLKLFSSDSNAVIYNALKTYASHLPRVNSIKSVRMCESRRETFQYIERKVKKLSIPKSFYTKHNAIEACANGMPIVIKLDIHNSKIIAKEDRIIGVANNPEEFEKLTRNYKENDIFFQQYLGKFDKVYKVYVVGNWAVAIKSINRLKQDKLSPVELVRIRHPIETQLKRRIVRLGRKMGMPVFGVDYVLNKNREPYIVDINDFPSFRNIPESTSLISDYIFNQIDNSLQKSILDRVKSLVSLDE